jgi:hypothetical protein
MMPDRDEDREKYAEYLNDLENGIPDHVRKRLLTFLEEEDSIRYRSQDMNG